MPNPYDYMNALVHGIDPMVGGVDPMVGAAQRFAFGAAAQAQARQQLANVNPAALARIDAASNAARLNSGALAHLPGMGADGAVHPVVQAALATGNPSTIQAALSAFGDSKYGAMIDRLADQMTALTRAQAGKAPTTLLPIGSVPGTAVVGGASATFVATPTNPIRITDFTVAGSIAANFVITSLIIGRLVIFQSGGAVPADRFVATATKAALECPPLYPGAQAQVIVTCLLPAASSSPFFAQFDAVDLAITP